MKKRPRDFPRHVWFSFPRGERTWRANAWWYKHRARASTIRVADLL